VNVAAGGEGPVPGPRDDDAADFIIGPHARDRIVQFRAELVAHRIELLRAIHGEDRHTFRFLDEDAFARHLFLLARGSHVVTSRERGLSRG